MCFNGDLNIDDAEVSSNLFVLSLNNFLREEISTNQNLSSPVLSRERREREEGRENSLTLYAHVALDREN